MGPAEVISDTCCSLVVACSKHSTVAHSTLCLSVSSRGTPVSLACSISSSVFGVAKGLLQEVETEARVGLETWAWLKTSGGAQN